MEKERKTLILSDAPDGKKSILGVLLGIAYISFLIYIPLYVMIFLFGSPTNELDANVFSTIAQIITAFLTIILMIILVKEKLPLIKNGVKKEKIWGSVAIGIGLIYIVSIALSLLDTIIFDYIFNLGEASTNANQSAIEQLFSASPVTAILLVVVAAPIVEELTFRYFIFGPIVKRNVLLAFIISGSTFGLIHMGSSFVSFAKGHDVDLLINDLRSLPDYIGSGVVLAYVYYRSKTILAPIFAHSASNLISAISILSSISYSPVIIKDINSSEGVINVEIGSGRKCDLEGLLINDVYLEYILDDVSYHLDEYVLEDNIYTFNNLATFYEDENGDNKPISYYLYIEYQYIMNDEVVNEITEGLYVYAI